MELSKSLLIGVTEQNSGRCGHRGTLPEGRKSCKHKFDSRSIDEIPSVG